MRGTRVSSSLMGSIPESASSIDVVMGHYPSNVYADIDYSGDSPYLRVAASKDSEDPKLSEDDIRDKISQWKKHTQEFATGAGFRKAHKGNLDPRKFAIQLSEIARRNAQRYQSMPLARLAKKLRWVAKQERSVAARELAKIAGPDFKNSQGQNRLNQFNNTGMPTIQKPAERVNQLSLGKEKKDTDLDSEAPQTPGASTEYTQDQSWRAKESSRHADHGKRHREQDLVTLARDFLNDYKSTNSLADDDDLLEQLQSPEVFESWLVDLDSKGISPDPDQLDDAWQRAVSEVSEGNNEPLPALSASRSHEHIQPYAAPGGDWANTLIRMDESPVLDRYFQRMDNSPKSSRRANSEVKHAADQLLDHYAGEMVPSELSPEDVEQFVSKEFPKVSHKKVYDFLQKISDPKRRHEEDPKERFTNESSRKGLPRKASSPIQELTDPDSPFDDTLRSNQSQYRILRGHRQICACCQGTGTEGPGTCLACSGGGRTEVDPHDDQLDRKALVARKLGTLLVVSVDANRKNMTREALRDFHSVTRDRVASPGKRSFIHSPNLMQVLIEHDIPYRTVSYKHRKYGSRVAVGKTIDDELLRMYPDKKSWWLDIDGEVIDAGHSHTNFMKDNLGISHQDAIEEGFISVASMAGSFVVSGKSLNRKQFESIQTLLMGVTPKPREVEVLISQGEFAFEVIDFLNMNSPSDLLRRRR